MGLSSFFWRGVGLVFFEMLEGTCICVGCGSGLPRPISDMFFPSRTAGAAMVEESVKMVDCKSLRFRWIQVSPSKSKLTDVGGADWVVGLMGRSGIWKMVIASD